MRPSKGSAGPSQRQLRAGELIRHALADILMRGDTGDPELERLAVSVVEVQMSPDLRIATAYVRGLLKEQDQLVLAALERNKKYIRGLVALRIDVKYMPEIRFRIDTSLEYAAKIDELLADPKVAGDLKHNEK
jgi:ribosome-binding factor A